MRRPRQRAAIDVDHFEFGADFGVYERSRSSKSRRAGEKAYVEVPSLAIDALDFVRAREGQAPD